MFKEDDSISYKDAAKRAQLCLMDALSHYKDLTDTSLLSAYLSKKDFSKEDLRRALDILAEISEPEDSLLPANLSYDALAIEIEKRIDSILSSAELTDVKYAVHTANGYVTTSITIRRGNDAGEEILGDTRISTADDLRYGISSELKNSSQIRRFYASIGWKKLEEYIGPNNLSPSVYRQVLAISAKVKLHYYAQLADHKIPLSNITDYICRNFLIALKTSTNTNDKLDVNAYIAERVATGALPTDIEDELNRPSLKFRGISDKSQKNSLIYYSPEALELAKGFYEEVPSKSKKYNSFDSLFQAYKANSGTNTEKSTLIFETLHTLIKKKRAEMQELFKDILTEDEINAYVATYYIQANEPAKAKDSVYGFKPRTLEQTKRVTIYAAAENDIDLALATAFKNAAAKNHTQRAKLTVTTNQSQSSQLR